MKISAFLSIIFLSFLSCSSSTYPMTKFQKKVYPRKSFLSIEKRTTYYRCTKKFCKRVGSVGITANGSIIKHTKDKTYVLTAAHLVWLDMLNPIRRLFIYRMGAKVKAITIYSATDYQGKHYMNLKLVSYNKNTDLAILSLKRIKFPVISIAKKAPKIGDMLYNISTPAGMMYPGTIPFFKGNFMGYFRYGDDKAKLALTNIPTAKGASGSPILNSDGHLVGMISAVHKKFHHISFSPTHNQIVKFVKRVLKGEKIFMCLMEKETPTSRPLSFDSY